jgi:hypothetical protein
MENLELILTSSATLIAAVIAAWQSFRTRSITKAENESLKSQIQHLRTYQESRLAIIDSLYKHLSEEKIDTIINLSQRELKLKLDEIKRNLESKDQDNKQLAKDLMDANNMLNANYAELHCLIAENETMRHDRNLAEKENARYTMELFSAHLRSSVDNHEAIFPNGIVIDAQDPESIKKFCETLIEYGKKLK